MFQLMQPFPQLPPGGQESLQGLQAGLAGAAVFLQGLAAGPGHGVVDLLQDLPHPRIGLGRRGGQGIGSAHPGRFLGHLVPGAVIIRFQVLDLLQDAPLQGGEPPQIPVHPQVDAAIGPVETAFHTAQLHPAQIAQMAPAQAIPGLAHRAGRMAQQQGQGPRAPVDESVTPGTGGIGQPHEDHQPGDGRQERLAGPGAGQGLNGHECSGARRSGGPEGRRPRLWPRGPHPWQCPQVLPRVAAMKDDTPRLTKDQGNLP